MSKALDLDRPVLQLALDFLELSRALRCAEEAVAGGADWVEIGTPLLKSEGLDAVRAVRKAFPEAVVVCDAKTMDAGRAEMESAAKAGADLCTVLGVASDSTLEECVEAGRNYGVGVVVDLLGHPDPAARAAFAGEIGADVVNVHCPIDDQMRGGDPFDAVRAAAGATDVPVSVAGGITAETAGRAVEAGARIVIVGGYISKSTDARASARAVRDAMAGREPSLDTGALYRRGTGDDDIRAILEQVSVPNVSDGAHRRRPLEGLSPIAPGLKLVGPAVTVRTAPGDWAKPVEAIDRCRPGDVLVVDAGGAPPAIWGELATHSAVGRGLAGLVVDGAVRDTPEIRRIGFPVFARRVCPNAGEPKGFGEIGVPVRVGGGEVHPGDWLVGDDDGLLVLPRARAAEWANRAMDCLEKENRVRHEITDGGSTLNQVSELYRWEKTR